MEPGDKREPSYPGHGSMLIKGLLPSGRKAEFNNKGKSHISIYYKGQYINLSLVGGTTEAIYIEQWGEVEDDGIWDLEFEVWDLSVS